MKKSTLFLMVMSVFTLLFYNCEKAEEIDSEWYNNSELSENLRIMPHESIDEKEFVRQYRANQELWDKSFKFLKENDLTTISPGMYTIEEGNSTAYVSIEIPSELDEISWEAHDNFIDLQYIVQGKTLMGIAPRESGTIAEEYDSERDVTIYEQVDGKYIETDASSFFLFFPTNLHRPAIKMDGYDEIKKILLKIRAAPPET